MRPIRDTCRPRPEVLTGDLQDAIFAADFGRVINGSAPRVYRDPAIFFRNTYPTDNLRKVVQAVFERLTSTEEGGATVRLSTGFGGGKTHALLSLWHLARNIGDPGLGTQLLPAAQRPGELAVAAADGDKLGAREAIAHPDLTTHSLWGELAYQLGTYSVMRDQDNPELVPNADRIRAMMPADRPLLLLLDEMVLYMAKLSSHTRQGLLAFLGTLMAEVDNRPGTVLVISDPGAQAAFSQETSALEQALANALGEFVGRRAADFDPIGRQAPQVIVRRLLESVDEAAAQQASAEYLQGYRRVREDSPELLPAETVTLDYSGRIVQAYPFHPRLLETAQERLSAMGGYHRSRGTLRLFARILRDVWDSGSDVALVQAADIDWSSERIRGDLLRRLERDQFQAAADADVDRHAGQLDRDFGTDAHRRVASALLLESLPLTPSAAMDRSDLTLATFRPSDVGHEASEAIDRLMSVCWHLYSDDGGRRFQFRFEPNANKVIEERAQGIPEGEAIAEVKATVQGYFSGPAFQLVSWPTDPRAVPDTAKLKLVLMPTEEKARSVCEYEDDSDPAARKPRAFRNAILAIAPSADAMTSAVALARRKRATEEVVREHKPGTPLRRQLEELLPAERRRAQIQAIRAFSLVILAGRRTFTLDERYLVPKESPLQAVSGQTKLAEFLADRRLVYEVNDALDVGLLVERLIPGATPSLDHEGAFSAKAVHERALMSEHLRLMRDGGPVRNAILKAVREGNVAVRLPSGDVYDAEGRVSGRAGSRKRYAGERLSALNLDDDVFVAPAGAPCVVAWVKVDEVSADAKLTSLEEAAAAKECGVNDILLAVAQRKLNVTTKNGRQMVVEDDAFQRWQHRAVEQTAAYTWDEAIALSEGQPLLWLELSATDLGTAKQLIAAAPPLGAQTLLWNVSVSGSAKGGGLLNFAVSDAKASGALKPLDLATTLLRTLEDGAYFDARLRFEFGEDGTRDAQGKLLQAQQSVPNEAGVSAEFGRAE